MQWLWRLRHSKTGRKGLALLMAIALVLFSLAGLFGLAAPSAAQGFTITPQQGPYTGGTPVTLQGDYFTGATAVEFGGTPAASFTVESGNALTAVAPAGTGAVFVTVTTPQGTSLPDALSVFTYAGAAPTGGGGGGGGAAAPPVTYNSGGASVQVGSAGGTVAAADDSLSLQVPSGAFSTNVQVVVSPLSGTQAPPPPGGFTAAAVWSVDTGGVEPAKPVTASFKYDPNALQGRNPARLGVYHYDPQTSQWTWVGGVANPATDTITVTLTHFSTYAVMANTTDFTDIAQAEWARGAVDTLLGADLVAGVAPGVFDPNQPMTRAEFVVFVDKVVGVRPGSPAGLPFTDVPPAAWYAPYVAAAYRAGIAAGVSTAAFDPSGPVSRQEAAVLLIRAMGYRHMGSPVGTLPAKPPTFTDQGGIAAWARTDVVRATEFGLIHGYPDRSFRPTASLTRAEGAMLAAGLLQDVELARHGILPE